ncbi:MAG: exosortase/archaeosortase family protein [Ferruginibacter sp.]
MFDLQHNKFLRFSLRFLGMFALCYGLSLTIIGMAAPGGWYSPFIDHYLNFIGWLRSFLLWGTKSLLNIFGIDTYYPSPLTLKKIKGRGIIMIYSCIGYGVMSFWIAYVFANEGRVRQKFYWMLGGLLLICFINIIRLSLVLISINSSFRFPFFDHHTWFTIIAYILIFAMMLYYNRMVEKTSQNLRPRKKEIIRQQNENSDLIK